MDHHLAHAGFSLLSVYSFVPILVKVEGGSPIKYLFKHLIYVAISFAIAYWIHRRDPKILLYTFKNWILRRGGLAYFHAFSSGVEVNGAGRWIRIPFAGLTFQSSDFAKLALVVYVSRLMVKKAHLVDNWKEGFLPILAPIIIICALIVKDNFSTAAILFSISLAMLFLGKIPFGKISIVLGCGLLLVGSLIGFAQGLARGKYSSSLWNLGKSNFKQN